MKTQKKWPQKSRIGQSGSSSPLSFLEDSEYIVEGLSAVNEYLRFRPRKITKIVCNDKDKAKLVPSEILSDSIFETLDHWKDVHKQSPVKSPVWCVVHVDVLEEEELKSRVEGRSKDIIIALDHVTDPRNLGAIARSCGFFGVKEILIPKDRQVKLTAASVSTSQGAFSLVDLFTVTNLARTLSDLKDSGYWIIGADMDGEALKSVSGFYDKTVLVFGAEGSGLSSVVTKKCDRIVSISAKDKGLESLNVSVAAAIVINEFTSKFS